MNPQEHDATGTPANSPAPDTHAIVPAATDAAIVPAATDAAFVPAAAETPAASAVVPKFGIPPWVPDATAFVVPDAPLAVALPPAPTGSAFPMGTPVRAAVAPGRRSNALRPLIGIIGLVFVLFVANKLVHHDSGNPYETKADAVTTAIINNNMKVVEPDFNAARIPELENHTQVGRLSDMLNALGAFKGSKEITPPGGTDAATHEFVETFANGKQLEKYSLDADGKILRFHIGPVPSGMTTP